MQKKDMSADTNNGPNHRRSHPAQAAVDNTSVASATSEDTDKSYATRKPIKNIRGRPFLPGRSGNPNGRPLGSRNAATLLAERLLDGQAEGLIEKLLERAFGDDMVALRLCIERLLPPRRDRPITFDLLAMRTAADATAAMSAIGAALWRGELTAAEAAELGRLVESFVRALEAAELEQRIGAIESRFPTT